MSETNETMGRCRREMTAAYKARGFLPNDSDEVIADALDRLAADVAAVKEATLPQTTEERDCAIRERDEARAEVERRRMQLAVCAVLADSNTTKSLERDRRVHPDYDCDAVQSVIRAVEREITCRSEAERLRAELAEAIKARDDANAAAVKLIEERNAAVTRRDERDKLKALVDELKAACDQWRALAWDQSEVTGAARAESDELRAELDEARGNAERLRAELAARPKATGWLTADDCWQLRVTAEHLKRLGSEACVKTIEGLLDRAGSPPVVEVPVLDEWTAPARLEALAYRAALDKAGVPWKEVPRE